jgi:uncharacterized OB-fold protein
MKVTEYLDKEGLRFYHKLLIQYIDKRIDLAQKGSTNCPNCGAIITDKTCSYCGTNLIKWYEIKE